MNRGVSSAGGRNVSVWSFVKKLLDGSSAAKINVPPAVRLSVANVLKYAKYKGSDKCKLCEEKDIVMVMSQP